MADVGTRDGGNEVHPAAPHASVTFFPQPPKLIACGFYHSSLICNSNDGKRDVYCWGRNKYCCLGITSGQPDRQVRGNIEEHRKTGAHAFVPPPQDVFVPTKIESVPGRVYEVACGTNHTAFLVGGELFVAGFGTRGRLGRRDPNRQTDVEEVEATWFSNENLLQPDPTWPLGAKVLRVVCGADHTLCVVTDGNLYSWGANTSGECGVGHARDVFAPTVVANLDTSRRIMHFAAGAHHSMCLVESDVYSWGCGRNGRLGIGSFDNQTLPQHLTASFNDYEPTFVACGEAHSGVVDRAGTTFTWGAGSYGRLGHFEMNDVPVPQVVVAFCDVAEARVPIKVIAFGGFHSLFLCERKESSKLFACGSGAACGFCTESDSAAIVQLPQAVKAISPGTKIVQIACGQFHSMVLLHTGEVVCWGIGANGRLGMGDGRTKNVFDPTPIRAEHLKGIMNMETIMDPSEKAAKLALRDAGGRGHLSKQKRKTPWHIKQICLGSTHSLVLTHGGLVYAWGCNKNGQLGLGSGCGYIWLPRHLVVSSRRRIAKLASGYDHCLGLTLTSELWVWGCGSAGQLGTGYAKDLAVPTRVESITQVVAIGAGEEHSAAIVRDRSAFELYTWGNAETGLLGLGKDTLHGILSTPQKVNICDEREREKWSKTAGCNIGPIQVYCGQSHTAVTVGPTDTVGVVSEDYQNKIFTFGNGWYGKLGLGNNQNAYVPTQVAFSAGAAELSLGSSHTGMISTDGRLYLWGQNKMCCEPIGNDHIHFPKKFQHIEGNPKLSLIACGEHHTLAVTKDGAMWVWGSNKYGQLGLGESSVGLDIMMPESPLIPSGSIDVLSTGPGHTVAIMTAGETYAWGNQSCGRLGLQEKQPTQTVPKPAKVAEVWASIESTIHQPHAGSGGGGEDDDGQDSGSEVASQKSAESVNRTEQQESVAPRKQQVIGFSTMQVLIQQEQKERREESLHKKKRSLQGKLESLIIKIKKVVEDEQELAVLFGDIEQSFKNNAKNIKHVKALSASDSLIKSTVAKKLPLYNELLWVLQQQVSYLAQLSISGLQPSESEVFYTSVKTIFQENHERTQHLFHMLLRIIIDKETEVSGQKLEDIFNSNSASGSRAIQIFSDYALSEIHYEDIVHPFLRVKEKDKKSRSATEDEPLPSADTTLLSMTKGTSERDERFALTYADFREVEDGKKDLEDKQEQQAEFSMSRDRFREFMQGPFVKSVVQVDLPPAIRFILSHALQAIESRQFHGDASSAAFSPKIRACIPLLRLFCEGILCPMLKNIRDFANKRCYLRASAEVCKDQLVVSNLTVIAKFLERMCNGGFIDKDYKMLAQAEKVVKTELLKYLLRQSVWSTSLEVQLMVDVYKYHFERVKHYVIMSTSDLLKLSNLLKKHMNKLRIKETDALQALCDNIPVWPNELIQELTNNKESDYKHNFVMNTRFLFHTDVKDVVVCRATRCPMPRSLVGQVAFEGLLMSYQQGEDHVNPRRALEALLREIDPIESKNFVEMQAEFVRLRDEYKGRRPLNYEMVQRLQNGMRLIEELVNVEALPEDVLQFMENSLVEREMFQKYLMQVEAGINDIHRKRGEYEKYLKVMIAENKAMRDFSNQLDLPQDLIALAPDGVQFKFVSVKQHLEKKRSSTLDPTEMQSLKCSNNPVKTYSLAKLQNMKVISELHPKFHVLEKHIQITFRGLTEGGVEMVVTVVQGVHQNAVKTLLVSEAKLMEMRRSEKAEKFALGQLGEDPFLYCISANFVKLVAELSQT
eukprot:TRINITY_DN48378_c0_g1_i1.p1 TRINITY_DN48378_c0_g1~~TRINITY_DN48378_c0_g1_i1.p1  ORF type:complete len:1757 (+),score=306.71 TRINITY_DN48378_c0_g1_i1:152-5422(+)